MSNNTNSDDAAQLMFQEMVEKHKLTPTGIERAVMMYQSVSSILNKYRHSLNDPNMMMKMEEEMIITLAKEMDRNFFEGMLDAAMKTLTNITKIPQVKDIQKAAAMNMVQKMSQSGSPEADKIQNLLKKLYPEGAAAPKGDEPIKNAVESVLDSLGISPRVKKEDLN